MSLLQVAALVILQVGGNFLFESVLNQYLGMLPGDFFFSLLSF